jgi:hypothetical protein
MARAVVHVFAALLCAIGLSPCASAGILPPLSKSDKEMFRRFDKYGFPDLSKAHPIRLYRVPRALIGDKHPLSAGELRFLISDTNNKLVVWDPANLRTEAFQKVPEGKEGGDVRASYVNADSAAEFSLSIDRLRRTFGAAIPSRFGGRLGIHHFSSESIA